MRVCTRSRAVKLSERIGARIGPNQQYDMYHIHFNGYLICIMIQSVESLYQEQGCQPFRKSRRENQAVYPSWSTIQYVSQNEICKIHLNRYLIRMIMIQSYESFYQEQGCQPFRNNMRENQAWSTIWYVSLYTSTNTWYVSWYKVMRVCLRSRVINLSERIGEIIHRRHFYEHEKMTCIF